MKDLIERISSAEFYYEKQINEFVNELNKSLIQIFLSISYSEKYSISCINLKLDDIKKFVQNSNKAIEISLLAFDYLHGRRNVSFEIKREVNYFPGDIYFNAVMNAKNRGNYEKFADNYLAHCDAFIKSPTDKYNDYPDAYISLAYLLKNDKEKSRFHIERSITDKKPCKDLKGFYKMISGILDKEEVVFLEGLDEHFKWYKSSKEMKQKREFPYSITAIAFVNLARYKGLNFEIKSPYVHPEAIKPLPEGFVYEGIPEIYEAIEKAEKKANSVGKKIMNFFKK